MSFLPPASQCRKLAGGMQIIQLTSEGEVSNWKIKWPIAAAEAFAFALLREKIPFGTSTKIALTPWLTVRGIPISSKPVQGSGQRVVYRSFHPPTDHCESFLPVWDFARGTLTSDALSYPFTEKVSKPSAL